MNNNDMACGCEGVRLVTPIKIMNHPNQERIHYRVGTHSTFLDSMLAGLTESRFDHFPEQERQKVQVAISKLKTRNSFDPSIAFLDCWATIADVLSFYQQYIANEGFLATATEEKSIYELARQVGYRLKPGLSASTYLAFNIDGNQLTEDKRELLIPKGTAAKSIGAQPQTFETSIDIVGRPQWNDMKPRRQQLPDLQVGNINDLEELVVEGSDIRVNANGYVLFVFNDVNLDVDGEETVEEKLLGEARVVRKVRQVTTQDNVTTMQLVPSPLSARGFARNLISSTKKLALAIDDSTVLGEISLPKKIAEPTKRLLSVLREPNVGLASLDHSVAEFQQSLILKDEGDADIDHTLLANVTTAFRNAAGDLKDQNGDTVKGFRSIKNLVHDPEKFKQRVVALEGFIDGLLGNFAQQVKVLDQAGITKLLSENELDHLPHSSQADLDNLKPTFDDAAAALADFTLENHQQTGLDEKAITLLTTLLTFQTTGLSKELKEACTNVMQKFAGDGTLFKGWRLIVCATVNYAFGITSRCLRVEQSNQDLKHIVDKLPDNSSEFIEVTKDKFKYYPIVSNLGLALNNLSAAEKKLLNGSNGESGLLDWLPNCNSDLTFPSDGEVEFESSLLKASSDFCTNWTNLLKNSSVPSASKLRACFKIFAKNSNDERSYAFDHINKLSEELSEWTATDFNHVSSGFEKSSNNFLNSADLTETVFDNSKLTKEVIEALKLVSVERPLEELSGSSVPGDNIFLYARLEKAEKEAMKLWQQLDASRPTLAGILAELNLYQSEFGELGEKLKNLQDAISSGRKPVYSRIRGQLEQTKSRISLWNNSGGSETQKIYKLFSTSLSELNQSTDKPSSLRNTLEKIRNLNPEGIPNSAEKTAAFNGLAAIAGQLGDAVSPEEIEIQSSNPFGGKDQTRSFRIGNDEAENEEGWPDFLTRFSNGGSSSGASNLFEKIRALPPNSPNFSVYIFERKIALFGHDAPSMDRSGTAPAVWTNKEQSRRLSLDGLLPEVSENSFVVIENTNPANPELNLASASQVERVYEQTRQDYGLTRKCTTLELDSAWFDGETTLSPLRNSQVFCIGKVVQVAPENISLLGLPIASPFEMSASEIQLNGVYDGIKPDSLISISGTVYVTNGQIDENPSLENTFQNESEIAVIKSADLVYRRTYPGDVIRTKLTLSKPLKNIYDRSTVKICANVAPATHGETKTESLGNGEGTLPNQKFRLSHPGVSQLPSADSSQCEPQIKVHVNNVEWDRISSIRHSEANSQVFGTYEVPGSKTVIRFGDGKNGARLPDGAANVFANYRVGVGEAGNVKPNAISQLASQVSGLDKVFNPTLSVGGAAPETVTQARQTIPISAAQLDRLVSLPDYQKFALLYPGIEKAFAKLCRNNEQIIVTVALNNDQPFETDSVLINALRESLIRNGAMRYSVRVVGRMLRRLFIDVEIGVEKGHALENLKPVIIERLKQQFGFRSAQFERVIYRSEFTSIIQSTPGVKFVQVTGFGGLVIPDFPDAEKRDELNHLRHTLNEAVISPESSQAPRERENLGAELSVFDGDKTLVTIKEYGDE